MNKKFICIISLVAVIMSDEYCYSSIDFSWGIKGGINVSRLISIKESAGIAGSNFPKFAYPIGYSVSIFGETKFTINLSMINELSFNKTISEITIYTGEEGIVSQKYYTTYLRFPCLLKLQTHNSFSPYFLIGPDIGILIKAIYEFSDEIYNDYGTIEITKILPSVDASVTLGAGKKFDLLKTSMIGEIRCVIGLTRYKYIHIGTWKNFGIQFLLGVHFK